MSTFYDKMTTIANAIREHSGDTEPLTLDDMAIKIADISQDVTATANDILSNKTAYIKGKTVIGTIPIIEQAAPVITVDSDGKITASVTQSVGYLNTANTKTATKQLTTKSAVTITPNTSNQTIAAGTYLTGTQTIAGDPDLVGGNIRKGVNIFGVDGSYDAVELNFNVKAYNSEELLLADKPTENTIGVVTDTPISSWIFSTIDPVEPTDGMVRFYINTASNPIVFNALKKNHIEISLQNAKQYISGVWVNKTVRTYQNGEWLDLWNGELYDTGNEYELVTGGWQAYARKYDGGSALTPTIRRDPTSLYASIGGGGGTVHTVNKINITGFSYLFFDGYVSCLDNSPWVTLGLWSTTSGDWQANLVAQLRAPVSGSKCTLDLTNVADGEYYIGFGLYNNVYLTLNTLKLVK